MKADGICTRGLLAKRRGRFATRGGLCRAWPVEYLTTSEGANTASGLDTSVNPPPSLAVEDRLLRDTAAEAALPALVHSGSVPRAERLARHVHDYHEVVPIRAVNAVFNKAVTLNTLRLCLTLEHRAYLADERSFIRDVFREFYNNMVLHLCLSRLRRKMLQFRAGRANISFINL